MTEDNKVFFLGGGNMAEAFIRAIYAAKKPVSITVIEKDNHRRNFLKQNYPNLEIIEQAIPMTADEILFIAVKPQDITTALSGLILHNPLIVSIVSGLSIKALSKILQGQRRIIRMMPNTPISVLKGMSGLYASDEVDLEDKKRIEEILENSGKSIWVAQEEDLHAVTAISGSGPGYIFYFMDSLYEAAKQLHFNEEEAKKLVVQMVLGTATLAENSSLSFKELQNQITSKKGTTFEAISVFEKNHLKAVILEGVQACFNRSQELAKELEL